MEDEWRMRMVEPVFEVKIEIVRDAEGTRPAATTAGGSGAHKLPDFPGMEMYSHVASPPKCNCGGSVRSVAAPKNSISTRWDMAR